MSRRAAPGMAGRAADEVIFTAPSSTHWTGGQVMHHTPAPWQQGRFVDSLRTQSHPAAWKAAAEAEERKTIRGPGVVGRPECNVVARVECNNPVDFQLMLNAAEMYEWIERLVTNFGGAHSVTMRQITGSARALLAKINEARAEGARP